MRTTIAISDDLLEESKRRALEQHTTLGEFIDDVLRVALSRQKGAKDRAPAARLPTFRGKGLRPGVDLDHASGLLDIMEER